MTKTTWLTKPNNIHYLTLITKKFTDHCFKAISWGNTKSIGRGLSPSNLAKRNSWIPSREIGRKESKCVFCPSDFLPFFIIVAILLVNIRPQSIKCQQI